MAQYKVPQDVEADDKLIGPFSFRQFLYLMIAGGLVALAVGLFQIFPLLVLIPLPPIFLLLALALPLKKDQPMETYLAALVSYYIKPRRRVWTPGQRESTIQITAPKKVEENKTRDITEEEATHRLSFLADLVDTEGYSIKGLNASVMRDDLAAEASQVNDIFESYQSETINKAIAQEANDRHKEAIDAMREAIDRNSNFSAMGAVDMAPGGVPFSTPVAEPKIATTHEAEAAPVPELPVDNPVEKYSDVVIQPEEKPQPKRPKASIMELANNSDFSVATIAKEANRIKRKENGEVYISLH